MTIDELIKITGPIQPHVVPTKCLGDIICRTGIVPARLYGKDLPEDPLYTYWKQKPFGLYFIYYNGEHIDPGVPSVIDYIGKAEHAYVHAGKDADAGPWVHQPALVVASRAA
jgi:hypothetical protein